MSEYQPVSPTLNLPAVDREISQLWRERDTFAATLRQTAEGEPWTFYEGPPTANGMPGTHHIEARVFKDVFPRFRTMQGRRVDRKAGWDCHGLPVELAVETELGLNGKPDIEAFGVEAFNARCRESVQRHVDAFTELTERIGYWVNLDSAYWTMSSDYVQSVWWALSEIFKKGLLHEDFRVAPYCPRCGTGLSDHELAQGYETISDPSVYVRLPLTSGPYAGAADLLIWTTTPWTLPANALVAVKADVTYVIATPIERDDTPVVVAESLLEQALGEGWQATERRFTGSDMQGWTYDRPFELVSWSGPGHFVVCEDYVTTDDGTGLVHQAPSFGADDFESGRRNGIELVNPIDARGRFDSELELIGGTYFRDANPVLIENLIERGRMFRHLHLKHSYPHCWRCHSALMYYAQPSWYIRTTQIKGDLLRENEATTWFPNTIKWGRFGDWLNNNVDWALSRSRYWGTPLPIWRNDEDPADVVCVASLAELSELTGRDLSELDPHRPLIDDITFTRDAVSGTYRRVPEVIDAWFDSGSMPFAQWGFPHAPGSQAAFEQAYPADFICEAIDQTRGWFYTLMAVGTLVFDQNSYRNVLCLGLLLAEDGRKMSKHLGNIIKPIPLLDEHGADAVRWFMVAGGSPWAARRVGDATITETVRKVLLTYWNTVAFQVLYARTNHWAPVGEAPAVEQRPVLDRWLVSATQQLIAEVTAAMETFDTQRAGQLLSDFIDVCSNWYVRRSRRRFWDGDPAALWTLHECLDALTRLLAPITPFITEKVWQAMMTSPCAPESVHLASWPVADLVSIDSALDTAMQATRRLVELGRAARAEAGVRTRQPLRRALLPTAVAEQIGPELRQEIATELNVLEVGTFAAAGDLVEYSVKANFRALGKRFGKRTPVIAAAVAAADPARIVTGLETTGIAKIEVEGEHVELNPDEVMVAERPREGWSVMNDQGETIALDLELTPELVRMGLAREVVRLVQHTRKSSGFEVSDRISVQWSTTDDELAAAVIEHQQLIAAEVLAQQLDSAEPQSDWHYDEELGLKFTIARMAAGATPG